MRKLRTRIPKELLDNFKDFFWYFAMPSILVVFVGFVAFIVGYVLLSGVCHG
jgi:uncharacterized integral membrane protein